MMEKSEGELRRADSRDRIDSHGSRIHTERIDRTTHIECVWGCLLKRLQGYNPEADQNLAKVH
jgi:hypothetical protein